MFFSQSYLAHYNLRTILVYKNLTLEYVNKYSISSFQGQPWYDDGFRIVLLGNPILFWINLTFLLLAPLLLLKNAYGKQRKLILNAEKSYKELKEEEKEGMLLIMPLYDFLKYGQINTKRVVA